MTAASILLFAVALSGIVPLGHLHLGNLSMLYWLCSWLAQTFAAPFALGSAALAVYATGSIARIHPAFWFACPAAFLFVFLHYRNHRMGRALLRQVASDSGFDEPAQQALLRFRVSPLAGLLPGTGRRADVENIRDIAYGSHGKRNLLDLYRPRQLPANPMPVLVQVHGGAWVVGDKGSQALPLMYHMAASGWLCVSINYRLGPTDRFPAMLEDVLSAIAWIRQHAADYGGDPGFIALTGGSAGGHLSALAGLVGSRAGGHPEFRDCDSGVAAVLPLYGRYDFLDRSGFWGVRRAGLVNFKSTRVMPGNPEAYPDSWRLASPVDQLHADAPPFLLVHGSHDSLISVQEARYFVAALRKVSHARVEYAELKGAQHAFDILTTPLTCYFLEAARAYLDLQRQ